MPQTELVLRYMERYGWIDAWTAAVELRCMRLAARIADLKKQGVPIKTEMRSRDGKRWAVYALDT